MEENESKGNEAQSGEVAEKVEKKRKKRQKKMLAELQKQIEFYFSEPNLRKDRFIRQKISESEIGCIEIETIASFNRMKQLCGDISLIVKAMKQCPSVETKYNHPNIVIKLVPLERVIFCKVIDDKWVKPSHPLPQPKDVDSVTVYVEQLPSHADHDWIRSVFSPCGNVVYVSLPRFQSKHIKGFAFVEFEQESEAEAAVKMFTEKPKEEEQVKTEDQMEDDEEHVVKHHKKTKKRKAKLSDSENDETKVKSKKSKRKIGASSSSISDVMQEDNIDLNTEGTKKNKQNVEKEVCEETGQKEIKQESGKDSELSESDDSFHDSERTKRKRKRSETSDDGGTSSKKNKESQERDDEGGSTSCIKSEETNAQDCNDEVEMDNGEKKKKKRKRKKKEKLEEDVPQLRVISKTEWLNLKKEYQRLQRQAMNDAKKKLKIEQEAKEELRSKKNNEENQERTETEENRTLESGEKTTIRKEKKQPPQKLEMQPGVVLKFYSDENMHLIQLKEIFSTISPVAYLHKEDNSNMGYVRFATKGGCDKVVEAFSSTTSIDNIKKISKIEKLTEKQDAEYWEQLNNERLEVFQHKRKRNKHGRGRQKITKRLDERNASKREHIHFDD